MDWEAAEDTYEDEVIAETTLGRLFESTVERYGEAPAQKYKGGVYERSLVPDAIPPAPDGEFAELSYRELGAVVRPLAAGFREMGVKQGDRVGIFAHTRMEWAQTDFALLSAGAVVTTVYTSSTPDQAQYLLSDPGASAVVVENEELLGRVLAVEDDLDLECIVSMDDLDGVEAYERREDVVTLADVYDRGVDAFDRETYEQWVDEPAMDDLASLIYTSGTTGKPKGVCLTHRNFRSAVNMVRRRFGPRPDKDEDVPVIDEHVQSISYLPLAHVFERTCGHFSMFASGACVGYAESVDTLREDFGLLEPHGMTSVPRVYEKIWDGIHDQAEESEREVLEWATEVAREYIETDDPDDALESQLQSADDMVFSRVREGLGGNVETMISGGGSLSPELCELFHVMGLPIYEGYGLTETAALVSANPAEEPKVGTIGTPFPGVEIQLDESVAGEDLADDGQVGELLVKGPNVTDGYWQNPDATDDAFTEDGWFRTGDVVHVRPDGYLEFRERAKQLLVLSTGKNVAPGPIEDAFAASEVIKQCFVMGDGQKFVSALLVPNEGHIREWAREEGLDLPEETEKLCQNDRVHEYVSEEVERINEQFQKHEQIKKFRLVPTEFTEENNMLTPTMKKKRREIKNAFEKRVEQLYDE